MITNGADDFQGYLRIRGNRAIFRESSHLANLWKNIAISLPYRLRILPNKTCARFDKDGQAIPNFQFARYFMRIMYLYRLPDKTLQLISRFIGHNIDKIHPNPLTLDSGREVGYHLFMTVSLPALVLFLILVISIMIQILSAIGFSTAVLLFISFRYQKTRENLQPKWWYGLGAICIVCHFALALMIYEEFPIIAIPLVVCGCGLSYVICRMAVLEDRMQKRRGKRL